MPHLGFRSSERVEESIYDGLLAHLDRESDTTDHTSETYVLSLRSIVFFSSFQQCVPAHLRGLRPQAATTEHHTIGYRLSALDW